MTDTTVEAPAVGTASSWARFLLGFAVLYGVLAVPATADPTGRRHLVKHPTEGDSR